MASDATATVSEGPVLSFINKRLRALRKKHNRILQMEESVSQGKPLNKEQEEVLRSKPAVSEEISLALQRQTILPEEEATPDSQPEKNETQERQPNEHDHAIEDLLNLLYFGLLFDVESQIDFTSTMLTRIHERGCCLTYDYVTEEATDLLSEKDLDLIATLSGQLTSRPVDSSLSHKNALQRCAQHAKLWLSNSDQPIDPNTDVSYAGLRQRLNKIMSLDYFTTTPEIKDPVEVAAAAVSGTYTSFQVPVQSGPISVPVQVEDSALQYQPKEAEESNYQEAETGDNQYHSTEELQQDNLEKENHADDIVQQEHDKLQADNAESKEQQYVPRRPYQNQRGGRGTGGGRRAGRGGRGSGRGGVTYQNGHNDQPGNSYSRNQYNRGRGGGQAYNNQGDNHSADVGVAS